MSTRAALLSTATVINMLDHILNLVKTLGLETYNLLRQQPDEVGLKDLFQNIVSSWS